MTLGLTPRQRTIAGGVLVAVVVLLVGYAFGALTSGPDAPAEDSASVGFARDMSAHHAQAVELGMIAYPKATLPEVRTLGGDIALTQQSQIGMMNAWLADWGYGPNSDQPPMAWMPEGQRALDGNRMPGMATREEITGLKNATGSEVDVKFLQYMLRHHLGGIHMVDGVLAQDPTPEVRALAETMKKNQSGEIEVIKGMLAKLGAQPLN